MSATLLGMPQSATSSMSVSPVAPLDLSDERLMEQIQAGNSQALGEMHDRYACMVKALVMKVLHDDAESDDLVQEIFLEIWDRAANYDPANGKVQGWIITLSRRRALERLRKREAYCRADGRLTEPSEQAAADAAAHVEENIPQAEMRAHFQRVLATLPRAQRQAIELAFYKGMSQREIAAHTGRPLVTVKTRLELGLKKVAEALKGYENVL